MTSHDIVFAVSLVVMLAGAVGTLFAAEVTRLVLALGTFLIGVALAFLTLGSPFLAVAEVFAYVGGVLVLVLFALMMTRRSADERPRVASLHTAGAALTALAVFGLLVWGLAPVAEVPATPAVAPEAVADVLLGSGIVAFELVGGLLLLALLAVLVVVKGGER